MLSIKRLTQLITVVFFATSAGAFAHPNHQHDTTKQFEGSADKGIMHYEGDLPDNLANPLDSTDDELEQEEEELEALQAAPSNK